ncbi:putative trans-aconitate 2-methyltransferase [bacterium HR40]|nr:putative trans-aconitate 2-methyltransferase [bacterium HR40]
MAVNPNWDPERYARDAAFVPALAAPVVAWLAPEPGERILDLGCGDGTLSLELVAAGATVVGIDSSPEMVRRARARGLDVREMDARELPFVAEFDAVFSNAVLHWIRDGMDAVIQGVARALRPGGRFVGEMGGFGNVAAIATGLLAVLARHGIDGRPLVPWTFPSPPRWRERLERHGLEVERLELVPRPTRLDAGLRAWLELFAGPMLTALPQDERDQAIAEVEELLAPALRDEDGRWWADYVRLRFRARRPATAGS